MIEIGQIYAPITADELTARVSDFAFRVYVIIYILNFRGERHITDSALAKTFLKSIPTANRAVNELRKADMIKVNFIKNNRYLTVTKPFNIVYRDAQKYETSNNDLNPALKHFFESWHTPK